MPKSTSVWISSRDIPAVRAIQSEHLKLKSYCLAPLRKIDLQTLATQAGVDGDRFLHAAKRQGILSICAKPLGCNLAVSVFIDNGLMGVTQSDLWRQGVERLCDETQSQTRQLSGPSKFTLDQIVKCSAWIFLCLVLSDNQFVWSGEESYCPHHALSISKLRTPEFDTELIRTALERGVFSPLGDGRIAHSHAHYKDYLAALGFTLFIPAQHWVSLTINSQRDAVFPQRTGIAVWLATHNSGFLEELSAIQPELLLGSDDSVRAVGPDKLCAAFLNRADNLSFSQRQNKNIRSNLHRLKDSNTPKILKEYLLDKAASSASIEVATAIAMDCNYTELASLFVDRVLDVNLSLRERVNAAYAVCMLEVRDAQRQLKSLLPIDPAMDPDDDLRGIVLQACWPESLTCSELIALLIKPQKRSYSGAYYVFLKFNFPESLSPPIDENSAVLLLNWAVSHFNYHDEFDLLGWAARAIYTACWKQTKTPEVSRMLAQGYQNAMSEYQSPFLFESNRLESRHLPILTRDEFLVDADGRLAILEMIVRDCSIGEHHLAHYPFTDFPLYTQSDLPGLFERVFADSSNLLAERWAICIKTVLRVESLEAYQEQIDRLHALRPDLIDSFKKIRADMEESAVRAEELKKQLKKRQNDSENKHKADQNQIDCNIKETLQIPNLEPESFMRLSFWLSLENGRYSNGSIDIQLYPGWKKLTEDERSKMLDLAKLFLTEGEIRATGPGKFEYYVACALNALRLLRPSVYMGLSHTIWKRCAVELLKAPINDKELLAPLLDKLSEQFPDVATAAVLEVLSQERQSGSIFIIRDWGNRLNEAQAQAILRIADDPTLEYRHRFLLLNDLVRQGKKEMVSEYLAGLLSGGWNIPPDQDFHQFRMLAFALNPDIYIGQLLEVLSVNKNWGKQWLESTIGTHECGLQSAFLSCEVSDVTEMYIWLHEQYPDETCPLHDDVYTPGPLDDIHDFKRHIINHLSQSGRVGSMAAFERIMQRFPVDAWLKNCSLDAKLMEQTKNLPVLTIPQVREFCDQKASARRLINSVRDLLDLTMAALKRYQTCLHGDTPAVGDLWNTLDPVRPRDEEYLSDHLKRYLDLTLTTNVIINREVQIRRKQFKEGQPGSRTDIWVQAIDSQCNILTLCIEVKCNWNDSAKTALKDQLIRKYMSGGVATAGILLLGWYECSSWDKSDNRLEAATKTWPEADSARIELQSQASKEQNSGFDVRAFVLDCALR
ncbi:MAG: hypothetical protein Q7U16_10405 [Agitococcus sp.]|nr:hypothetical protein [Agitococcus sp.]